MNMITILISALVLALIMLTAFSLIIISTALNKKNIKLDLFAFNFSFGKLVKGRIGETKPKNAEIITEIKSTADVVDKNTAIETFPAMSNMPADFVFAEIPDTENSVKEATLDDFERIDELDDFGILTEVEESEKKSGRTAFVMEGMKKRFVQAQNDAQAKVIERETKKLQEDMELYDPDETMEELPEDFNGKLKYWWRNHFGFRIGICTAVAFLIFTMVFYGFHVRNEAFPDKNEKVAVITDEKEKESDEMSVESDPELEEFRKTLDKELAPVDAGADSLPNSPNLAEIMTTAQREVGATPLSYTGSNTTTQPSGAIGTITIPSINLKNAPVMGSVELSDLSKGTGHFENTPVFDGNVGIAGHNNTHFKYLVNVDIGDQIQYTVNGVTRTYQVIDMRAISDTDWGVFQDYGDNRLTLVTCEHLVPDRRIAVTAIQVGTDRGLSNSRIYTGKINSSFHQDSGDYHDAGSGYTDYIGVFTGNN